MWNRVDHEYQFVDRAILINNVSCKYETPYKGPYKIIQFWKWYTYTKMGATIDRLNIWIINPYKYQDAPLQSPVTPNLHIIHMY